MSWCTIESDPGVFTELIEKVGVKGVQVNELWDLEDSTFAELSPVYGLIFLFKWERSVEGSDERPMAENAQHVFFAKQVIPNACATQAIVSVLLNRPELELGAELEQFKAFAAALPPDMRGLVLENSDTIRNVHNSFARPDPFLSEAAEATDDDEVYHFVAYVPVGGRLYELDGLKPLPIDLGECDAENWTAAARPAIQERMQKYSQREIRFNLLALVRDRRLALADRAAALDARREAAEARAAGGDAAMHDDTHGALPDDPSELAALAAQLADQAAEARRALEQEHATRRRWALENERRKHNYVPFIFNLLSGLAEKGQLKPLLDTASEEALAEARQRFAAAKAQKEKEAAAGAPSQQ